MLICKFCFSSIQNMPHELCHSLLHWMSMYQHASKYRNYTHFLVSWGNSIQFSTVTAPVRIPTNSALGFPFPFYNPQDREAAQVSINSWVDKTTMEHLQNGILLGHNKVENFTFCNGMDGPREHNAKWNDPVRERKIPCDFTHM